MVPLDRGQPESPITARAVGLGLVFAIAINLVIDYNDWYLRNTLLIGNHFPYIAIATLMALVLGVNAGLKSRFRIKGLSAGEMLLIWGMIGVAGGIGSAGLMRYLPASTVAPAYYVTASNDFETYIMKYLPDWMVVSRDGNSHAVRWFMEGLPRGGAIPWGEWLVPMAAWFAFMLCLYAANISLVSLFFRQWSVRERLIFPVVHVPVMLAEGAPAGSLLNSFLRNRLTWIGIAIPCLIWGINGLRSYIPALPQIPMASYYWSIFPDRPWSEFHPENVNVYFTVIGLTFLLTSEIAFSLWFTYLAYRMTFVFVAWLGSGATGFFGNWSAGLVVYETAGAMLAITAFMFWSARAFIRDWLSRALAGRTDGALDPLPPRLALGLMLAGIGGMVGWYLLAGAQWWVALAGVGIFLVVLLVLTRVIAESGLIFVQSGVIPFEFVTGLFPAGWFTGSSLTSLVMQKGVLFDLREIFMPYVMNGLKAADQARMNLAKVLGVFALTAVVAMGAAAFGKISTAYKYGGVNLDEGANVRFPSEFLGAVASFQKNPPEYARTRLGETKMLPVNVAHLAVGGALAGGMLVMRARFLWWPLHPFGMVMCGAWAMTMFWFSILLGWIAKTLVMTFGGASVYRRVLPLFLGLVVGESLIAAFWTIVGLLTGTPGIYVLPY